MNKFGLIISLLSVYQLCSRAAVVPGNQVTPSSPLPSLPLSPLPSPPPPTPPSPQISVLENKSDKSKGGYSPTTTELLEKLAAQLQQEEQADIESLYITLKKKNRGENVPLQLVDTEFSFRRSAEEIFLQHITAIRSVGATSRLNKDLCEGQIDSTTINKSQNDLVKFNAVCELIFNDPYFANKGIHVDPQPVSTAAPVCRKNAIKLSSGDTVTEEILMFPCLYYSEAAGRGTFWIFQDSENSSFFITEEASTLSQVKFLTCIFISEIDLINVLIIIEKSKQSTVLSADIAPPVSTVSSDSTVVQLMDSALLSDVRDFPMKLDSEFVVAANSAAVDESINVSTVPTDVYANSFDLSASVPSPVVAATDLKIIDSKKEIDQIAANPAMPGKKVIPPARKVDMSVGQRRQAAKPEPVLGLSERPVQSSPQKAVKLSGYSAKQLPSPQQEIQYVNYGGTAQDTMSVLQYIIEIIRTNYEQTRQLWWNTKLYDLFAYISQSASNSPIYSRILRIVNSKTFDVSELVEYVKSLFSNKKLMAEVDEFVKKYNESNFYSRAFQQIRSWFGFDCCSSSSGKGSYSNNNNNNVKGSYNNNNNGRDIDNGGYYRAVGAGPARPVHEHGKQFNLGSDNGKCVGKHKPWGQRDMYQERARSRGPLAPDGPLFSIIQKSTDCYSSVKQTVHQVLKCPGRKQPSYPYKQVADDVYSPVNQCEKLGSCDKYIANYDFEEVPVAGLDIRGSTDTVISVEQTTSDVYSSISQEVILVLKCAYWCEGIISIKQITDDTYDSVQQTVYVYMFCPPGSSPLVATQRESTDVYSKVTQESKHYVYYTNDPELYGGDCSF